MSTTDPLREQLAIALFAHHRSNESDPDNRRWEFVSNDLATYWRGWADAVLPVVEEALSNHLSHAVVLDPDSDEDAQRLAAALRLPWSGAHVADECRTVLRRLAEGGGAQ